MKKNSILALIGTSKTPNSTQSAQQVAQMILSQLPPGKSIGWALAFCGGRHDQQIILQELRAQLGEAEIIGGAAVGTITNTTLGYSGYECSVAAFPNELPKPVIIAMAGLDNGEFEVGRQLGEKLSKTAQNGDTVLLFYDSIRSGPPPVLYIGSQLIDGLYHGLAGKPLKLVGAGTIGDLQMMGSYIFSGDNPGKHGVVAVVLPSVIHSYTTIMHGCIPVSSFLEITKIEGAILFEIEGRPALTVLQEMVGQQEDPPVLDNLSLSVTIGQKHGDPFSPYDESHYVNRLILTSNPADGSVTLFEADFQVGSKIQIMSRDNLLMLESVQKRTEELLTSLSGEKPVFALYIDCAGRSSGFSGAEVEEASLVQLALGANVPLLGFYSGVEIAPLLGRSRPLDWTGVLTVLTLSNDSDC